MLRLRTCTANLGVRSCSVRKLIYPVQLSSVYFSMVYWWGSATRKLDGITIQLAPYAAYESRCIACQWRASDNLNLVWQIVRNFLCNPDMQKMLIFLFAQWIFNGKVICKTDQISRRVLGEMEFCHYHLSMYAQLDIKIITNNDITLPIIFTVTWVKNLWRSLHK